MYLRKKYLVPVRMTQDRNNRENECNQNVVEVFLAVVLHNQHGKLGNKHGTVESIGSHDIAAGAFDTQSPETILCLLKLT